ncbi:MAG TPA: YtxH domain-containing protein [Phototrophicaceae bacterium]|nr:YtxH domain-containing protein [Phototrophicaceae bacterium]
MNDRIYYSRDAEAQAMRERTMAVFAFFIVGVAIGGVLALMFAPRSGDRTRAELGDALDHSFEEGRKHSADAIQRLEHDFADLRKRVEERH